MKKAMKQLEFAEVDGILITSDNQILSNRGENTVLVANALEELKEVNTTWSGSKWQWNCKWETLDCCKCRFNVPSNETDKVLKIVYRERRRGPGRSRWAPPWFPKGLCLYSHPIHTKILVGKNPPKMKHCEYFKKSTLRP